MPNPELILFTNSPLLRKEANETLYWLDLLESTEFITPSQAQSLQADATEILKLLTSSIKTAKAALQTTD
ncbi:MAG: four helix bundle protein [Hymenobacter sp.]